MTKVVFVTQQVDPAHPALAATVPKLRALAELVDEVVVLADAAVEGALPDNCRVRTFGAATKAGRGVKFETAWKKRIRAPYGTAKANWIDLDSLIKIKNLIDNPRHQEDVRVLREVKKRQGSLAKNKK